MFITLGKLLTIESPDIYQLR